SDRIRTIFAALQESVPGTSRRFVATHRLGRYWRHRELPGAPRTSGCDAIDLFRSSAQTKSRTAIHTAARLWLGRWSRELPLEVIYFAWRAREGQYEALLADA